GRQCRHHPPRETHLHHCSTPMWSVTAAAATQPLRTVKTTPARPEPAVARAASEPRAPSSRTRENFRMVAAAPVEGQAKAAAGRRAGPETAPRRGARERRDAAARRGFVPAPAPWAAVSFKPGRRGREHNAGV